MAPVERVSIAEGGPQLSRLVYGTWRLLKEPVPPTPAELAGRLERCLDLGISTVDTAEVYGAYGVEELLGAALAGSPGLRARLQIVTKLGIYVPNPRHPERQAGFYDASAARIVKSVDKSLRLLRTEVIDLLLIHRPDWLSAAGDTAAGLERVVREGKVRHVGVSNFDRHKVDLLQSRLSLPLVTNQIELSLFQMAALSDGTLDQAQQLGRSPMAWSPLGGGRLFAQGDEVTTRLAPVLATLGMKYAGPAGPATPAALALAWVLAHPSRPLAVIGTSRPDRLEEAAHAPAIALERHDWYWLWAAAQGRRLP